MSETKITMTKEQLFKVVRLSEQENKKEENTSIKTNSGFKGMVSSLLQKYYEGIDALVDGIIESYQGKYDVIKQYEPFKPEEYKSSEQVINYFKSLDDMIDKNRKSVKESYIQNQIDTVQELIYSTLYKLRFLK